MKNLLPILIFIFAASRVTYCQDILQFKNGSTRKVTVLTTSETEVTCRDFETKEIFSILKSLVSSVEYQSGKTEPLGTVMPQFATYHSGAFTYRGIDYSRPKTMKVILLQNPDLVIIDQFNAYRTKRTFSQVFTFLGSSSLGWNIGGAVSGDKFDGKLLGGSIGAFIIGLVLDKVSNKNLKASVDAYNDNLSNNPLSFKTALYQDLNFQTSIGINIKL